MTNERAALMKRLVIVEESAVKLERRIIRQRTRIAGTPRNGNHPNDAKVCLQALEQQFADYSAERILLREQLSKMIWVDARESRSNN